MNPEDFIEYFRTAFGNYELPVVFWYSDQPTVVSEKTKGCFIKDLKPAREGRLICLSLSTISCGGGKTYTGFMEAPSHLPELVSTKERYKEMPEMVTDFINDLKMPCKSGKYINFVSIDKIESFDELEGLIFFATPDVLSGLVSWALFDTKSTDTVSVPFGSGCSSIISQTVVENQNNGYRIFIGMFDPSARPHVESNILSFAIPMSMFKKMYYTIGKSCLSGTRSWKKVKERIINDGI